MQRKKRLLTAVAETQQNNTGDSAPSVVAPTNANLDYEIQRELAAKSVLLEKAKEKRDKIRGECDEFYRKRGGQGNRSKVHRNSVINSAALCTKLELELHERAWLCYAILLQIRSCKTLAKFNEVGSGWKFK